jgi:carbonic anhydrase
MSAVDDYLKNNAEYALSHEAGLGHKPSRQVAIVACMDCRMNVPALLGLADGEAHVLRNAGGVVTDDMIRSLAISQRVLGTREIMLIHHTDCGMSKSTDDAFKAAVEADTGIRPPWAAEMFADAGADVRQSIARLKSNPFIPHKDAIRGFVFDVATGRLNEVL